MARKTGKTTSVDDDFEEHILDTNVGDEMQASFLEYAYSVIYSRALPDARDGLKPVLHDGRDGLAISPGPRQKCTPGR